MGWIGKAAAITAVVTVCFAGVGGSSTAAAQAASGPACKRACSNTYSACQRRAINSDTCLRRWLACKKKCSARPGAPR